MIGRKWCEDERICGKGKECKTVLFVRGDECLDTFFRLV